MKLTKSGYELLSKYAFESSPSNEKAVQSIASLYRRFHGDTIYTNGAIKLIYTTIQKYFDSNIEFGLEFTELNKGLNYFTQMASLTEHKPEPQKTEPSAETSDYSKAMILLLMGVIGLTLKAYNDQKDDHLISDALQSHLSHFLPSSPFDNIPVFNVESRELMRTFADFQFHFLAPQNYEDNKLLVGALLKAAQLVGKIDGFKKTTFNAIHQAIEGFERLYSGYQAVEQARETEVKLMEQIDQLTKDREELGSDAITGLLVQALYSGRDAVYVPIQGKSDFQDSTSYHKSTLQLQIPSENTLTAVLTRLSSHPNFEPVLIDFVQKHQIGQRSDELMLKIKGSLEDVRKRIEQFIKDNTHFWGTYKLPSEVMTLIEQFRKETSSSYERYFNADTESKAVNLDILSEQLTLLTAFHSDCLTLFGKNNRSPSSLIEKVIQPTLLELRSNINQLNVETNTGILRTIEYQYPDIYAKISTQIKQIEESPATADLTTYRG